MCTKSKNTSLTFVYDKDVTLRNKTAKKFIKQYGSLENLLQNAHEVTGKLGEKIIENKELGVLSKKLAKIIY